MWFRFSTSRNETTNFVNELLIVEGVTKRFKNRCVLDDVGFSVRAGEVLGLIGPNGAGKTTLFECLAGLMPANAGTVKFAGHVLAARSSQGKAVLLARCDTPLGRTIGEMGPGLF